MEMYKIITLVLILNIAMSMIVVFKEPEKGWTDWTDSAWSAQAINKIRNINDDNTDEDNLRTQQNADQLEYTGGVSKFMLVTVPLGLIENVLFGGLRTSIVLIYRSWDGPTILSVFAWACTLFMVIMQTWLSMKLYTWIFNKDAQ